MTILAVFPYNFINFVCYTNFCKQIDNYLGISLHIIIINEFNNKFNSKFLEIVKIKFIISQT